MGSFVHLLRRIVQKYRWVPFVVILFDIYCGGSRGIRREIIVDTDYYYSLSWQQKIIYFESLDDPERRHPQIEIYRIAFRESVSAVVISSLKKIPEEMIDKLRPELHQILKHSNPVIRWLGCKNLSRDPVAADLEIFISRMGDPDWLVRECIVSNVRKFPTEKIKKRYFFTLVSKLPEKNTEVLRQLYKTLKWYNDQRAIPYMYRRSFHTVKEEELIVIIQELSSVKDYDVESRLKDLAYRHPSITVREEAKKALSGR